MALFTDLEASCRHLQTLLGDVEAPAVPPAVTTLDDEKLMDVMKDATAAIRLLEVVRVAATGVIAARSGRDAGRDGLAQQRGHRTPASLIQELTGTTAVDARRQLQIGEALVGGAGPESGPRDPANGGEDDARRPWHSALGDALMGGRLASAQHHAILRGLGEPPSAVDDDPVTVEGATAVDAWFRDAWAAAATRLIEEAQHRTVEELGRQARVIRDQLDPEGARHRFDERFAARSYRTWTDQDGVRHGHIRFDDAGGAWMQAIFDAALKPRRGGPRFVGAVEQEHAERLEQDPRTNEQLGYDLLIDVMRSGALADAASVFGVKQAGVRVVTVVPTSGDATVSYIEETGEPVPASLAEQQRCSTSHRECGVDENGDPLYLGREARLFSPNQKLALALRDGGCRWRGCDRPAHYCEAHHIDPYAEGGRTDVDRGILLCRWHHMQLHHGGWRITRDGRGEFLLHPPDGSPPTELPQRVELVYAWAGIDPPPLRFRPAA
jgi:hypothetical protein